MTRSRVGSYDDYSSPVQTTRTVTRYRIQRNDDDDRRSRYDDDSRSNRRNDNIVEVDRESDRHSRRPYNYDRYSRSSETISEAPPSRRIIAYRPRNDQELVRYSDRSDRGDRRPEYESDDEAVYIRRRQTDDYRRQPDDYNRQIQINRYNDVRPADSVSQEDYSGSSDDSTIIVKRKVTTEERGGHKRHLVEGALVGAVGAEVLRRGQKRSDEHRTRDVAGGALIGGAAIEAISRARSRNRKDSSSPDRRHGSKSEKGGDHDKKLARRSSSHDRLKKIAEIGAGAVIAGALVKYGLDKNREKKARQRSSSRHHHSRSRSRPGSRAGSGRSETSASSVRRSRSQSRGRRPSQGAEAVEKEDRKKKLAQAGLGAAAIAAAVGYARSRSRKRSNSEEGKNGKASRKSSSQNLIEKFKTEAGEHKGELAVAAIGAAALAAYQGKKKHDEQQLREQSMSRSRSRGASGKGRPGVDDDGGMIEYGSGPVEVNGARRGRGRSTSRNRSRSRSTKRSLSVSERLKDTAEAVVVAGAAAVGANELKKKYEDRRRDREQCTINDVVE
jgi:hypothetical protein